MKIIAITGTPGTGKTIVGRVLAKKLGANFIELNKAANRVTSRIDRKRNTKIIDTRQLSKIVKKKLKPDINIVEGHLSQYLQPDIVIVLRTRPDELEKRLKKKKWKRSKIIENIEAELLDAITFEAMRLCKYVYELDTSKKTPQKISQTITAILKNPSRHKKYVAGKIDWSEKYMKYLIK